MRTSHSHTTQLRKTLISGFPTKYLISHPLIYKYQLGSLIQTSYISIIIITNRPFCLTKQQSLATNQNNGRINQQSHTASQKHHQHPNQSFIYFHPNLHFTFIIIFSQSYKNKMNSNRINRTYSQYLLSADSFSAIASLVQQIENNNDDQLIQQTTEDIRVIMAYDYPPLSKVLAIRLVKELFLINKQTVISSIQDKLLDEVSAVAMYKDNQKGATFFSQTNFYKNSDQQQKHNFRSLGIDYVLFCKDSISTWASLIPFTIEGYPSKFALKQTQLLRKGVQFPPQRYLYNEANKEAFQKIYKVQFFNEDSSMSQSLLNQSNCEVVLERELSQFEQLLQALSNTLKPQESETDWTKVKTIMERTKIFFHQSSVKMLQQLKDLNMSAQYSKRVLYFQSRSGQLIENYEYLKSRDLKYQKFYNIYGNGEAFTPIKESKIEANPLQNPTSLLSPQVNMKKQKNIVSQIPPIESLRQKNEPIQLGRRIVRPNGSIANSNIHSSPSSFVKKQNPDLIESAEQRILYENKLAEIEGFYKSRIEEQKQKAEVRINQMKKLVGLSINNSQEDWLRRVDEETQPLRNKIQQLYEDLKESEIEKERLRVQNKELQVELLQNQRQQSERQKEFKRILQESQKAKNRANQYQQKIQYLQKQISREPSIKYAQVVSKKGSQVSEFQNKKLQKRIDNLVQENGLLKGQLNRERGRTYENMAHQTNILKNEIQRLKKSLKQKQQNQRDLLVKLDKHEILNLKLKQQSILKQTKLDFFKKQNQRVNKTLQQVSSSKAPSKKADSVVSASRSIPRHQNRLQVKDYLEVGMQGSTYYNVLSREFQVKYKRSCFKKKQLLYKQFNIEVGVITEVKSSNQASMIIFLTNYGTKDLNNVRLKVLNPTSNQIQLDTNSFQFLPQGDQQKVYIDALIQIYPIGPVVLKLEYYDQSIQNTAQLLLPLNIIKFVRAVNRHNQYLSSNGKSFQIQYDRKIIQAPSILKEYFPNIDYKTQDRTVLRMSMIHDHTKTEWDMDIELHQHQVEIRWSRIISGYEEIQEYYCKTLKNLLSR